MSSIETLKNDIRTIDELGEITEVLEQIAAKSIIEARDKIIKSRDFFSEAWKIYDVIRKLTTIGPDVYDKDLVIVMTPNRGMCGTLMNRVIAVGERLYKEHQADLLITGKKGHNHFFNRNERTIHFFSVPNTASFEDLVPLKDIVSKYSRVHIVFPKYVSISQQDVEVVSLLNEKSSKDTDLKAKLPEANRFIIEPGEAQVVNYLNKAIIGVLFFSYFSESLLAYNAAQMLAMRNAHDNANEQLKGLQFSYHKLRREIIDSKLRDLYKFKYIAGKGA